MSREAMELALEALESDPITHAGLVSRKQAITALRQALETEQKPVAWLKTWSDGSVSVLKTKSHAFADHELEPLYAAPPKRDLTCVCGAVWDREMMVHPPKKREWVGLHGSEVPDTYKYDVMFMEGWLWAEERLKEKNHG